MIAHELGHLVLGLNDEYADNWADGEWCGWGATFDDAKLDGINNSLMQRHGKVCLAQRGRRYSDINRVRFVDPGCDSDKDCGFPLDLNGDGVNESFGPLINLDGDGVREAFTCVVDPLGSELSTETNADEVMGDWAMGGTPQTCPAALPSSVFTLVGTLSDEFAAPGTTCSTNTTVDPGEQCQTADPAVPCGSVPGHTLTGGNAPCSNCVRDLTMCTLPPRPVLCGNGAVDPGEECDPLATVALPTCASLASNSTSGTGATNVACNTNCTFDIRACADRRDPGSLFGLPSCSNGGLFATIDPNEQCEGTNLNGATCAGVGTGTPRCDGCWLDKSPCIRPATPPSCVSNGVLDPGEECDPALAVTATCQSRGFTGSGGTLSCNASCVIDERNCQHDFVSGFDLSSFDKLTQSSQMGLHAFTLVDGLGRGKGEALHTIFVAARARTPRHWSMLFVADAKTFGGTAGNITEIGRFDLEFDAVGALKSINGDAVDAQGKSVAGAVFPRIIVGSATAIPPAFGTPTLGSAGQSGPTGAFPAQAGMTPPAVDLELRLGGLQSVRWTNHLGQNAGAWLWNGSRIEAKTAAGTLVPARGVCPVAHHCQVGWNSTTNKFEASSQTLAALPPGTTLNDSAKKENKRASRFVFSERFKQVTGYGGVLPTASMPAGSCGSFKLKVDPFDKPGQFMLVLDRSGSMEAIYGYSNHTRLWHMQEAAKAHTRAVSDTKLWDTTLKEGTGSCSDGMDNDTDTLIDDKDESCQRGVKTGLVSFNDTPCAVASDCQSLVEIGPKQEAAPNDCTGGLDEDKDGLIDNLDGDCSRVLEADFNKVIDALTPNGNTGIGVAMRDAMTKFEASSGPKAMVVLSDGENNRPTNWKGTANDPLKVAKEASDKGILVITVPVGPAADQILAAEVARTAGGEMYEASREDELPSVFLQAYAREIGQALSVGRTDLNQFVEDASSGSHSIPLRVEPGVREMTMLLSSRDQSPSDWNPPYRVLDPDRNPITPLVFNGNGWKMLKIRTPVAGEWHFEAPAPSTFGSHSSHFVAHMDNPLASCDASVANHVINGGETLEITAQAQYGLPLDASGVQYTARLRRLGRPFTYTTITLQPDPLRGNAAVGTFAAGDFPYRGAYEIVVECRVSEGARYARGEPSRPNARNDLYTTPSSVPAHVRTDRTSVYVKNRPFVPLIGGPTGDTDGDGILDINEPPDTVDTDGDGLPDPYDDDADGDDWTDRNDPAPQNPAVPGAWLPVGCSRDSVAPVFAPGMRTADVCVTPADVSMQVDVTDGSCPNNGSIEVSGLVIAKNARSLATPISVARNANLALETGRWVVRWTATDVNGNTSTYDQTLDVRANPENTAVCCKPGQSLVQGTSWPDLLWRVGGGGYCMFGRGSIDSLKSAAGTDLLSGGDGSDILLADGDGDILIGGAGDDDMALPLCTGGKLYGGPGRDDMELTGNGTMYGNTGDDSLLGLSGDQTIIPGPGSDSVFAGLGDDSVYIYDLCEAEALEILDGGFGNDTLYTPVPVIDLLARGVIVVGFENIVQTTANRHLSECF